MVNDNVSDESERLVDWPRRNVLKLAGVGVAGLGGAMAVGATDDEKEGEKKDGDESDDGKKGEGDGDGDHFLSDLVDPTFGYPLAADETDDVELRYVVEATLEEGPGSHPGFPTEDFGGPPADAGTPSGMNGTTTATEGTPAGPNEIPVEFFFDPVGLWVEPGSLVHFKDVLGLHTVSAFHEKFSEPGMELPNRVPECVPGFTSPPLTPEESWVYEFEEPGVYDYFCFPHIGLGMVGRIVVYDPERHDLDDEAFAVSRPEGLSPNDEQVLTAPELDPGYIVEHGRVAWSDITLDGEPSGTETGTTATDTDDGTQTDEGTENGTETDGTTGTETNAS